MLAAQPQDLAAGDKDLQAGTGRQQIAHHRRGLDDLLEVVEDQQLIAFAQVRRELVEPRFAPGLSQAERLGNGRDD
ncbi:MAG: hypothetical protein QOG89_2890 [Thermomicrobiales bacterium]|nr:hypothetical protein [Thermomicrobiales bacterium]